MPKLPPGITRTCKHEKCPKSCTAKYRARYRDGMDKEPTKHFALLADARAWLEKGRSDVRAGRHVDQRGGRQSFKEYALEWLAAQSHRERTALAYDQTFRLYAFPAFGSRPLVGFTTTQIQAWASALPVSSSKAKYHLSNVKTVFEAAVIDRKLEVNPAARATISSRSQKALDVWIPDQGQVQAAIDKAPKRARAILHLARATGLRIAEITALEVDDVSFLRTPSVSVTKQLVQTRANGLYFGAPKSESSVRTVPLDRATTQKLARHMEQFPPIEVEMTDRRDPRRPVTRTARLLFSAARGGPVTSGAWSHWWKSIGPAAGFPAGRGVHALRHYFASLMIRYGMNATELALLLGHSSAQFTWQCYVHLWPDHEERARSAQREAMAEEYAAGEDAGVRTQAAGDKGVGGDQS